MTPTPDLMERLKARVMVSHDGYDLQISHSSVIGSKGCTHSRGQMLLDVNDEAVTISFLGRRVIPWTHIREVQLIPLHGDHVDAEANALVFA